MNSFTMISLRKSMNPIEFKEGSIIQSVYTGEIYRVDKFYGNGMVLLYKVKNRVMENWNAYNNRHFIPFNNMDLTIVCLCL